MNAKPAHFAVNAESCVSLCGAHLSLDRSSRIDLVDFLKDHLLVICEFLDQVTRAKWQLRNISFVALQILLEEIESCSLLHAEQLGRQIKSLGGIADHRLLSALNAPLHDVPEHSFGHCLNDIHRRTDAIVGLASQLQQAIDAAVARDDSATAKLITAFLSRTQRIIGLVETAIPRTSNTPN